ncbi:WxcM-like domain-containing protein, partial [Campylobacter jejuni]|nr:WxcM-like domain-containing protein [Campylobacter jejuni]
MKNYKILKLDAIKDDRGKLVALESNKEIPF